MARIFVYDNREFPDPDPNLSVDDVRQSMAAFFPELSNAETKESKRGEDTIIEFRRKVGTKGRDDKPQRKYTLSLTREELSALRNRLVPISPSEYDRPTYAILRDLYGRIERLLLKEKQ